MPGTRQGGLKPARTYRKEYDVPKKKQDVYYWLGKLVAIALMFTTVKVAYSLWGNGATDFAIGAVFYFVFGYCFIFVTGDLWSHYKRDTLLDSKRGKVFVFIAGFVVMQTLMALLWPLFAGAIVEEKLRAHFLK